MGRADGLADGPAAEPADEGDAPRRLDDLDELRRRVVGHPLPGGTFLVREHERFVAHDALGSPALPGDVLHPAWVLLGVLREKGMTTEDLVALVGATERDGVLGGELTLEQVEPLRAGVEYRVRGEVTALDRRQGRRAGTMDLLTFELRVTDPGERLCATSTQTFVVLRGGGRES